MIDDVLRKRALDNGLSPDEADAVVERAAIIQHDGCVPRIDAENFAMRDALQRRRAARRLTGTRFAVYG